MLYALITPGFVERERVRRMIIHPNSLIQDRERIKTRFEKEEEHVRQHNENPFQKFYGQVKSLVRETGINKCATNYVMKGIRKDVEQLVKQTDVDESIAYHIVESLYRLKMNDNPTPPGFFY